MIAYLVFEDGRIFEGESWGFIGETFGEAVFATGMTGYQETMTDPSYCGQIVVMTAPHIGNTGVNGEDNESKKMWVSGFVSRDPSPIVSNWRADSSLEDEMKRQGIIGISGVDTRAITRHIRSCGSMKSGIFSGLGKTTDQMIEMVRSSASISSARLTDVVTAKEKYVVSPPPGKSTEFKVVALDFGIKSATPKNLADRGVEVHVLPTTLDAFDALEEIKLLNPDGFFMSNGPGDPARAQDEIQLIKKVLALRIPVFGICFGHQILGRALGLETYKLKFGHRGINQPVLNTSTKKVEITAQNHGFALSIPGGNHFDTLFGPGEVTHVSLNDGVVEGIRLVDWPAFSVQYHPEAAAGPHDSSYLFDDFISMMRTEREKKNAKKL